jgi:hypothetical protein
MKPKLYLFNEYHAGDQLTNRCLVRAVLQSKKFEIAIGSFLNQAYLYGDFKGVRHVISQYPEGHGVSLAELCPDGYIPINTWTGTFPDIDRNGYHNWRTIVATWNRQVEFHGLGLLLESSPVPMIDFDLPHSHKRDKVDRFSVYVENGATRSNQNRFHFNMGVIGSKYPNVDFYCTGPVECKLSNVIECRTWNLIQLSHWSNVCHAIIGKGSGPFLATYTEVNRHKPRAVVGFTQPRFWEYERNPLQHLKTDGELYAFLDGVIK